VLLYSNEEFYYISKHTTQNDIDHQNDNFVTKLIRNKNIKKKAQRENTKKRRKEKRKRKEKKKGKRKEEKKKKIMKEAYYNLKPQESKNPFCLKNKKNKIKKKTRK
jgi:hypothetical protein